ncbi:MULTISPECIES: metallophosphoesterase [Microbulbifer]|uniref:metallophosphoesterase n=1 Tax=Microbulbifer TaxID=48073 RepID=UPI001E31EA45|nr:MULTISPECIES: metallophosphoesterase [Microbulbifer]UHQ55397.1 metallophosphoesterase [Microbulbifer sp. YPW16]
MPQGYDIIGDIHGHAAELEQLLLHLGYRETGSGFRHPGRKVVFLGDFIDRGEHLRQHRRLLEIVMAMVNNGHALAVMGNHELNALAYHTLHKGEPLRPRTPKNTRQHQAFLNEFDHLPELKGDVLDFFRQLPLWLELEGCRVVHACWDQQHVDLLRDRAPDARLDHELLVAASTRGTPEFVAVETLLKGYEVSLPEGITFADKDGNARKAVRVQWWNKDATCLGDIALPLGVDIGAAASLSVPENVPEYPPDAVPCFIGHYWLHGEPGPLTHNVACLDYSVVKGRKGGGKLVAYRFDGEQKLEKARFTHTD